MRKLRRYKTEHGFNYIRFSDLPELERKQFAEWMSGATRPLIDSLDPQDACYEWDYDSWQRVQKGSFVQWD